MELKVDAKTASLEWDREKENLYLLADGKISKITEKGSKKEDIKIAGEMTLNLDAERAHMFEHIRNRVKGIFYTPDFHGVDWEQLTAQYPRYLPH
jgi:hypothetical protein